MKYFKSLAMAAVVTFALGFVSCDEDEDGFYNERYVNTNQIVEIQTYSSYVPGDFLTVTADIPRFLYESGQENPLDIYTTTGGAPAFTFTYRLEKQLGDGSFQSVSIPTESLEIFRGAAVSSDFILADAQYDEPTQTYMYHVGMPLETAGNYRFSYGVNSDAVNKVELRSRSEGNNLNLNIISETNQLNGQGFYLFTVQ